MEQTHGFSSRISEAPRDYRDLNATPHEDVENGIKQTTLSLSSSCASIYRCFGELKRHYSRDVAVT